jgi:hypothetical protein
MLDKFALFVKQAIMEKEVYGGPANSARPTGSSTGTSMTAGKAGYKKGKYAGEIPMHQIPPAVRNNFAKKNSKRWKAIRAAASKGSTTKSQMTKRWGSNYANKFEQHYQLKLATHGDQASGIFGEKHPGEIAEFAAMAKARKKLPKALEPTKIVKVQSEKIAGTKRDLGIAGLAVLGGGAAAVAGSGSSLGDVKRFGIETGQRFRYGGMSKGEIEDAVGRSFAKEFAPTRKSFSDYDKMMDRVFHRKESSDKTAANEPIYPPKPARPQFATGKWMDTNIKPGKGESQIEPLETSSVKGVKGGQDAVNLPKTAAVSADVSRIEQHKDSWLYRGLAGMKGGHAAPGTEGMPKVAVALKTILKGTLAAGAVGAGAVGAASYVGAQNQIKRENAFKRSIKGSSMRDLLKQGPEGRYGFGDTGIMTKTRATLGAK